MAPQVGLQAFTYKVGNTFVGINNSPDNDAPAPRGKRRSRKNSAQSVDETAEVRFGNFLEEDTIALANLSTKGSPYVIPITPSPLMHSASAPSAVPPLIGYGWGLPEMGLPPAFGMEAGFPGDGIFAPQGMDPQYMQDIQFMYDPSYDPYAPMPYPWPGMPLDESGNPAQGFEGEGFAALNADELAAQGEVLIGCAIEDAKVTDGTGDAMAESYDYDGSGGAGAATTKAAENEEADYTTAKQRNTTNKYTRASDGRGSFQKNWGYDYDTCGGAGAATTKTAESDEAGAMADYTTVMLRNIPNKYTREMLVQQLSRDFNGEFDFMYLPIDFKNRCNVGYCFINFRTCDACSRFVTQFHGVDVRKCLPGLNSRKVAEVTPARVQGMVENVNRLRNSPVMNQLQEHPEWMPLIFGENGELETFPSPEQPLQPVKQRGRGRARLAREAST